MTKRKTLIHHIEVLWMIKRSNEHVECEHNSDPQPPAYRQEGAYLLHNDPEPLTVSIPFIRQTNEVKSENEKCVYQSVAQHTHIAT